MSFHEANPSETTDGMLESIESLSQEIRRVGREVFKGNRAAERNRELFEAALDELRRLNGALSVPAPSSDSQSIDKAVFEAKASLCGELLIVLDVVEGGLVAAQAVVARLDDAEEVGLEMAEDAVDYFESRTEAPDPRLTGWLASARDLRWMVGDAGESLRRWFEGQCLLRERLVGILSAAGVQEIETVGYPFDPEIHRAVAVERRADLPAGTVVGEELRGYMLDGKILRFAEVIVTRHD